MYYIYIHTYIHTFIHTYLLCIDTHTRYHVGNVSHGGGVEGAILLAVEHHFLVDPRIAPARCLSTITYLISSITYLISSCGRCVSSACLFFVWHLAVCLRGVVAHCMLQQVLQQVCVLGRVSCAPEDVSVSRPVGRPRLLHLAPGPGHKTPSRVRRVERAHTHTHHHFSLSPHTQPRTTSLSPSLPLSLSLCLSLSTSVAV